MNSPSASTVQLPVKPAHLLFPPEQTFLWLPGFNGSERAYCTYNEFRGGPDHVENAYRQEQDDNGVSYCPLFPVSRETHIAWHTDVSPPFPYHPVPITRSLSKADLEILGRKVIELLGDKVDKKSDPLAILRNQHKCHVVAALAKLGLLPSAAEDRSILRAAS